MEEVSGRQDFRMVRRCLRIVFCRHCDILGAKSPGNVFFERPSGRLQERETRLNQEGL